MYEETDLKEISIEFYAMMEYQDEMLAEIDRKIIEIGKTLERTEWKIEHFGEAWPEDV
jgi:hypothetical protein